MTTYGRRGDLPAEVLDDVEDRKGVWADAERETIAQGRYEIPVKGDRLRSSYCDGSGQFKSVEGIVEDVHVTDVTVELQTTGFPTDGVHLELDLTDQSGEIVGFDHGGSAENAWALCRTEVLTPVSQVEHPHVEAGDTVKIRQREKSQYVERVEAGRVYLQQVGGETISVPVTDVTAFDEDVDDYSPFATFWDAAEETPGLEQPETPGE